MRSRVLPPLRGAGRTWSQQGQAWTQYVSKGNASRLDVVNLQEALDTKLMERQARESGICPVREDLYSQCYGAHALPSVPVVPVAPAPPRPGLTHSRLPQTS